MTKHGYGPRLPENWRVTQDVERAKHPGFVTQRWPRPKTRRLETPTKKTLAKRKQNVTLAKIVLPDIEA
jgi:hypothetical protein